MNGLRVFHGYFPEPEQIARVSTGIAGRSAAPAAII
jgi:hypothetical protein